MDMQKPGPRGRSSSINPGPRAAVECKTPGGGGGCWCLEYALTSILLIPVLGGITSLQFCSISLVHIEPKETCSSLDTTPTFLLQWNSIPATLCPLSGLYRQPLFCCLCKFAHEHLFDLGLRILMAERLLLTPFCLCTKKTDSFSINTEFLQIRGELPKLDLRHLTQFKIHWWRVDWS